MKIMITAEDLNRGFKNVNINGETMAQEYHIQENHIYVNNEQERMNSMLHHNLSYKHHDLDISSTYSSY